MEVALVRFIGAGLALVFEGFEENVPVGAVAGADRFIAEAGASDGALVIAAVERVTAEIWREWRLAKLPRPIAKAHLEALPALLDRTRVPRSQMIGAVSVARAAHRTGSHAPGHAARVASTVVGELKTAGVFKDGVLNESIAYFFIDRLLSHLLKETQLFVQLRGVFRSYIAEASWAQRPETNEAGVRVAADQAAESVAGAAEDDADAAQVVAACDLPSEGTAREDERDTPGAGGEDRAALQAAVAAEVERLAAAYRVPEFALAAFAHRAGANGVDAMPRRLEEVAIGLRNLLALMAEPAGDPHDSDTRSAGEEARATLAAGDPPEADRMLGRMESRLKRAAQGDFGGSGKLLPAAADVSAQRGLLAELSFDWMAAAEHYSAAARCLPTSDRKGRWRYLMSQALALERQGRDEDDTPALVSAASVHSDAARLLSEQDAPADWAQTYLQLGNLLLLLGKREKRNERNLAAALHFKPALDVFSQLHDTENWARAHWGLAEALRAQGEVQGDVEILSEAAFAYRATLGVLARDRMPEEWAAINFGLGATLLRLGQESGDVEALEEAQAVLGGLIEASESGETGPNLGEILAKHGHVLLALGAARGDLDLIAQAAHSLEAAIEHERVPLPQAATAAALDALGSALLVLAEADGNVDATLRAAEAKDAALSYYQSVGDEGLVESLTRELEEIVARLPDEAVASGSGASA